MRASLRAAPPRARIAKPFIRCYTLPQGSGFAWQSEAFRPEAQNKNVTLFLILPIPIINNPPASAVIPIGVSVGTRAATGGTPEPNTY